MTPTFSIRAGYPTWRGRSNLAGRQVEVRFTGRGRGTPIEAAKEPRQKVLQAVEPTAAHESGSGSGLGLELALAKQIHSDIVLAGQAGPCGEGDALFTRQANLALSVITADCVPVLLAGDEWIAAAHAGWRGLAAHVLARTLEQGADDAASLEAWIGPAIGPCCYEVSEEVAREVDQASEGEEAVIQPGKGERPHLDLHAAARNQLRSLGLASERIVSISDCTRCRDDHLWSYRRDGKPAGRNMAFIWRRD